MYQFNSTRLLGSIAGRNKRAAAVGAIVFALAFLLPISALADTLWYNGDFASNSFGVLNGINMTFQGDFPTAGAATVYDDFNVPAGILTIRIGSPTSTNLFFQ